MIRSQQSVLALFAVGMIGLGLRLRALQGRRFYHGVFARVP